MAISMRVDRLSADQITAVVSPLAELQAVLHALAEPDHHFGDRSWMRRTGEAMPEALRSEIMHLAPLWARRRSRFLMPLTSEGPSGFDAQLKSVAELPVRDFFEMAAHTVHGGDFDTRGLAVTTSDHQSFLASCERRSFSRGVLARKLVEDPSKFRERLIATLQRCHDEFFESQWQTVTSTIAQSATALNHNIHSSVVTSLRMIGPRVTVEDGAQFARFEKLQKLVVDPQLREVLLVPSVFHRPHLTVRQDGSLPVVIQFPIPEKPKSDNPARTWQRLAVLSDGRRLDLCRHLLNEASTTSGLAARTGMTTPQVSRHLARLREVGLLRSERQGRHVYHRLDTPRLIQLGPDLLADLTF